MEKGLYFFSFYEINSKSIEMQVIKLFDTFDVWKI